jgi:hypothetical protein
MKAFFRVVVLVLPLLVLVGCDSKPKPAEIPKDQMELPKTRPTPAGGGNKAPQTGQNHVPFSAERIFA